MSFVKAFLKECGEVASRLDPGSIDAVVKQLEDLRERGGRLFFVGSGGGAGHASHAVNDFRKIAGFEAYTPTDNVSELTARVNDEGWETSYVEWLKVSRFSDKDMLFVFSVGGGDLSRNVSPNLVRCLQHAESLGAIICGVVGRDGGFTAQVADACVVIPAVNPDHITAHTEAFQAVVWHLLVTDPRLAKTEGKWESLA